MKQQATMTTTMRKAITLVALVMVAVLALSALDVSDAEAKKKWPQFSVVLCQELNWHGTTFNDYLIGRDNTHDDIQGFEGNDVYDGKGGSDNFQDSSTTSNDYYLVPESEFGNLRIVDNGGSSDVVDLGPYDYDDFTYEKHNFLASNPNKESLRMVGQTGDRSIIVQSFYDGHQVKYFKFADGIRTADQIQAC